jgi:hypothetical protein
MQKGGIKKPLIIGIGATVAVIVVVAIILTAQCFAMFSGAKPVIEEFMEAAAANNTEAAYAYWSTQAATEEEIAELIDNNYDDVFAGYESLKISGWSGESSGGITTCDASGTVFYTGDKSLRLEASLVKQNGVWKMTGISIGY